MCIKYLPKLSKNYQTVLNKENYYIYRFKCNLLTKDIALNALLHKNEQITVTFIRH